MVAKILKENNWFFMPYSAVFILVIPFILFTSKADLHLWFNQYHSHFFDWIFKHITWLGDGLFICTVGVFLIFLSFRHSLFILSSYLATGLVTQLLKRLIFADIVRPVKYFQHISELHLVEGVKILASRSFPSGHATSAFAFFLCLAMIIKNNCIKLACLILACLVAYSRVYLSQHFLVDIYVGSLIGSIGAVGMYLVFYRKEKRWHDANMTTLFTHNEKINK